MHEKVVALSIDDYSNDTKKIELRRQALDFCRANYVGKTVQINSTGERITITATGIKHSLYGANPVLIEAIKRLPEVLQSAEKVSITSDKRGRPEMVAIHKYEAQISIDNKLLTAIIVIREDRSGALNFYDLGFIKA